MKALIKFLTRVGLPAVAQSDQGSKCTSRQCEKVMKSLAIRQWKSTVYHPQSQEVDEGFNYTLKTKIKTFYLETGSEGDERIDLLLFTGKNSVLENLD